MNQLELKPFKAGPVQVRGYFGHLLYTAIEAIGRGVGSKMVWLVSTIVVVAGMLSYGGIQIAHIIHERDLKSPVEKDTYVVEDARGQGEWMSVRHDTKHLLLKCEGSRWLKKEGDDLYGFGGDYDSSPECYEFKVGDVLRLEKWSDEYGSPLYVSRKQNVVGEDRYRDENRDK